MRRARFVTVIVVSWATTTLPAQTTLLDRDTSAEPLPVLFQSPHSPEAAYDDFRREMLTSEFATDGTTGAGQTKGKPKTPVQPSAPVERPPIDPSMVGYIDEAPVLTQIRVRFDAALHDPTPDRAEFFYAKCGCYRGLQGTSLYDPKAPGPGDEPADIPNYVNFQQLYFYGEYALKHRYSLFGTLPIRWLQPNMTLPDFSNGSGIGDIQVGAKFSPISSETHILTFQFGSHLATGDSRKGLGTHHATVEPMLLYYQDVAGRASIEAQFGDTHPLGTSTGITNGTGFAGDVLNYGAGGSYQFVQGSKARVAGVLEMVGWHILGGNVTGGPDTDGVNIVNLKIGPRVSYGAHQSFYFGFGIALTHSEWYHEIFRTEYRYAF